MNAGFLMLFLGFSIRNYYVNQAVFITERFGKLYISAIAVSLIALLFFSNRHIKNLYLDPNGKEVLIETYTLFGLMQPREKVFKIKNFQGNRIFFTPKLNVYQLEYLKEGKWKKRRSLFYRPEYIGDADIWQ